MTVAIRPRRQWSPPVQAFESAPAVAPADLGSSVAGPDGCEMMVQLAHDLRSPLTAVLCLTETLKNGEAGPITDVQRHRLDLIYSAVLGLCATASDAVEFARTDRRQAPRTPEPFSVDDVLDSVRAMVLPLAEEKAIRLEMDGPMCGWRSGHARELSRVLLNLATNAVKFSDTGDVEISAVPVGASRIEFAVRDSGGGIDSADRVALYQPFRRDAAGPSYYFSSSGLGLAICHRLVHFMGSELRVESDAGWGTRFSFELELPPSLAD